MRATFYCCCSIVSFGQFKQDQADKLRFLVMILSVTQTNKLSNEVGILDKNSSSFLFKKKTHYFCTLLHSKTPSSKKKKLNHPTICNKCLLFQVFFSLRILFLCCLCVFILRTYISDYLVVIMLLCRYVASVDQALRTFRNKDGNSRGKRHLKNKHLGNCDYFLFFTIFPSC